MQHCVTRVGTAIIISSMFIILSGCINNNKISPSSDREENHTITVTGTYIWGPEVRELNLCDGSPAIWAEGDDNIMARIAGAAMEKSEKTGIPWQPIYVEMDIRMSNSAQNGFAENYPAMADIIRIRQISVDIPSECHISTGR